MWSPGFLPTALASAAACTVTGAARPARVTGTIPAGPEAWPARSLPRTVPRGLSRSMSRGAELRVTVSASLSPSMTLTVFLVEGAAAEARLSNRELRFPAVRRLAIRTRQRGSDQPPMDGAFFVGRRSGRRLRVRHGLGSRGIGRWFERLGYVGWRHRLWWRHLVRAGAFRIDAIASRGTRHKGSFRSLAALRRDLRVLVLVVRVARHASRLLHLVVNHRNDCVIRDAPLARTVVVENVTEPNPALLHLLVRPSHTGAGRTAVAAGQISAEGLPSVVVHLLIHARSALWLSKYAVRPQLRRFPPEPVPVRWDIRGRRFPECNKTPTDCLSRRSLAADPKEPWLLGPGDPLGRQPPPTLLQGAPHGLWIGRLWRSPRLDGRERRGDPWRVLTKQLVGLAPFGERQ